VLVGRDDAARCGRPSWPAAVGVTGSPATGRWGTRWRDQGLTVAGSSRSPWGELTRARRRSSDVRRRDAWGRREHPGLGGSGVPEIREIPGGLDPYEARSPSLRVRPAARGRSQPRQRYGAGGDARVGGGVSSWGGGTLTPNSLGPMS